MVKLKKIFKTNSYFLILVSLMIASICINPALSIGACLDGILVWAQKLLPALLPFFFLTRLFSELGGVKIVGKILSPITKVLFNTKGNSGYVYAMSILSGYPVGSKLIADLYERGELTRGEAYRTCTFTSTSGPLFVIGTVGIGMFCNQKLGLFIMLIHSLGALINGLIYRNYRKTDNFILPKTHAVNSENILEESMLSSIKSIMVVGGYVCFFFVVITLLNEYNILHPISLFLSKTTPLSYATANSLLNGFVEITKGCLEAGHCGFSFKSSLVFLSTIISFGGLSINLQALTFLKRIGFSSRFYFISKTTQTLITFGIANIFCAFL